jgi:hypothetical protein
MNGIYLREKDAERWVLRVVREGLAGLFHMVFLELARPWTDYIS